MGIGKTIMGKGIGNIYSLNSFDVISNIAHLLECNIQFYAHNSSNIKMLMPEEKLYEYGFEKTYVLSTNFYDCDKNQLNNEGY